MRRLRRGEQFRDVHSVILKKRHVISAVNHYIISDTGGRFNGGGANRERNKGREGAAHFYAEIRPKVL